MRSAYAGGGDFNDYVDVAQEQIAHIPIPETVDELSLIEYAIENPWIGVIFLVGAVVCLVVAWRVFLHTKNQWVVEFRQLLGFK